jgi:hypothetical protein
MLVEATRPPEPTLAREGEGELKTKAREDDVSWARPSCCEVAEICWRLTRAVKSDELSLMERGAAAVVANGLRLQEAAEHHSAQKSERNHSGQVRGYNSASST